MDGGEGGGWCQAATYSSNHFVDIFPFCLCVCVHVCLCSCVLFLSPRLAFLSSVYVPFSLYIVLLPCFFFLPPLSFLFISCFLCFIHSAFIFSLSFLYFSISSFSVPSSVFSSYVVFIIFVDLRSDGLFQSQIIGTDVSIFS